MYVYEEELLSKNSFKSLIVTLPKKNKVDLCTDFEILSLLLRTSKIFI